MYIMHMYYRELCTTCRVASLAWFSMHRVAWSPCFQAGVKGNKNMCMLVECYFVQ